MNDDPYGTMTPAASILPLPAAIALLLAFFLLGILYAMCESAVGTASESRVKRDAESGSRRAKKFLAYLDANESFASPLQFGMMLMGFFSIGVSVIGFAPVLDNALIAAGLYPTLAAPAAVVLCTLLCAALFLLLADFTPKKFVAHKSARNTRYSYKLIRLIRVLSALMRPFMKLCDFISDGIMRLFGNDPKALDETVTEEEILHMVGEGEELGVIEETERDMITNILDFNDTTVSEVMTHRTDICAVSESATIEDVTSVAAEEGFSRLPVYREDIDAIAGICYAKDFLPYVGKPVPSFIHLRDMLRPAYFIPESKKCSQLFREFQERRIQIAVVVDEYGGTAGLITLEDLIESILGNIQDEYDNEAEEIFRVSENEFTVDGTTSIDEISDLTGVELPEGDYDTIAGLVTDLLGRIPKEGEHPSVQVKNLDITVLSVEDQRLSRLLIVRGKPAEEDYDEAYIEEEP
ncbi:MAG: hemolysin family protein [Acutalibacteraceae bacterium]